jgi:hypothetical protein
LGLNPYVFVVAGVLLVVGVVAFGLYAGGLGDSDHADPSGNVAVPAPPVNVGFAPSGPSAPVPETFYIVGSEAAAMTLQAGIADAEAIGYSVGEDPLKESVLLLVSDADAAAFAEAIAQGNLILAGLGLPEDRVVDLRGN